MTVFQRQKSVGGFTLIELMIVVAILGILAAVAVPSFLQYMKRAKTSEIPQMLKRLGNGETKYYQVEKADLNGTLLAPTFVATGRVPASSTLTSAKRDPLNSFVLETAFSAIEFSVTDPIIASYRVIITGTNNTHYQASALTDLDDDNATYGYWVRTGIGDSNLRLVDNGSALYRVNDLD